MTLQEITQLSEDLKCLISEKTKILLNNERFGTCKSDNLEQELSLLNNYNQILDNFLNSTLPNQNPIVVNEPIVITLLNGTTIIKEKITTTIELENCITQTTINSYEFVLLTNPPNPLPSDWQNIQNGYIRPTAITSTHQTMNCNNYQSSDCFDEILNQIQKIL